MEKPFILQKRIGDEIIMKDNIKYVNKICFILSLIILISVIIFNIGYMYGKKIETETHEKEEMVKSDEIQESDVKEITIITKSGKTYHFSSSEGDDK